MLQVSDDTGLKVCEACHMACSTPRHTSDLPPRSICHSPPLAITYHRHSTSGPRLSGWTRAGFRPSRQWRITRRAARALSTRSPPATRPFSPRPSCPSAPLLTRCPSTPVSSLPHLRLRSSRFVLRLFHHDHNISIAALEARIRCLACELVRPLQHRQMCCPCL